MQDFNCATHGVFEEMLDVIPPYEPVTSYPCKECGESAPSIWTKAPGLAGVYRHTVTFGGHTHDEADIEARLGASDSTPPPFYETAEGEAQFAEIYKANLEREIAGTLPPQQSEAEVQAVAKVLEKS